MRRRLVAVALLLGIVSVAWAHATLIRATPAVGSRVFPPPSQLRLEFSESVSARTSRVELISPDSQRTQLQVRGDSSDARALIADVSAWTAPGSYRVEWRLVGPDGHAVTGYYSFTVDSLKTATADTTRPANPVAAEPPGDTWLAAFIRFGSTLATILIIGGVAMALLVFPAAVVADEATSGDARLRTENDVGVLVSWSAVLLVGLAVARLVSHAAVLAGSLGVSAGDLADLVAGTAFGKGWLLQVFAATGVIGATRARQRRWGVVAGFSLVLAASAPFLGHPAAAPTLRPVAISLDAVHVLAAGGWAGGILVLALVGVPSALRAPLQLRITRVRALLRAFTPLALTCAGILAVTGIASAWFQLSDPRLVLESNYGQVLLRKVFLVLLIAALGAYHWRVAQPGMATNRSVAVLRGTLVLDVLAVLLVLLFTALLTGTAPPVR